MTPPRQAPAAEGRLRKPQGGGEIYLSVFLSTVYILTSLCVTLCVTPNRTFFLMFSLFSAWKHARSLPIALSVSTTRLVVIKTVLARWLSTAVRGAVRRVVVRRGWLKRREAEERRKAQQQRSSDIVRVAAARTDAAATTSRSDIAVHTRTQQQQQQQFGSWFRKASGHPL